MLILFYKGVKNITIEFKILKMFLNSEFIYTFFDAYS